MKGKLGRLLGIFEVSFNEKLDISHMAYTVVHYFIYYQDKHSIIDITHVSAKVLYLLKH